MTAFPIDRTVCVMLILAATATADGGLFRRRAYYYSPPRQTAVRRPHTPASASNGKTATTEHQVKTRGTATAAKKSTAVVSVPPSVPVLTKQVELDSGLVIVPFAVPVAVPVATVSEPTLLYGYSRYGTDPEAENDSVVGEPADVTDKPAGQNDAVIEAAVAILRRNCARCHSPPDPKGSLAMFDESDRLLERLPRRAIVEEVSAGKMPLGTDGHPAPLSANEIDVLRQWARPPRELRY